MKTVLSCCTAKVFARALLPMAAMSPLPQAAAENDNKAGSVPRSAWPETRIAREGRQRVTCPESSVRCYGFQHASVCRLVTDVDRARRLAVIMDALPPATALSGGEPASVLSHQT